MTRFLPALLLLPSLAGCVGRDGTYVLLLELTQSPQKNDIGRSENLMADLYPLADGTWALRTGGLVIPGTIEGSEFSFTIETGTHYESDDCKSLDQLNTVVLSGSFTPDLGMDGEVSSANTTTADACRPYDSEKVEYVYSLTGIKLDANPGQHPSGGLAWGYAGSGGYF